MKTKPFHPWPYLNQGIDRRDIPFFVWWALWCAAHGRFRFAGRLLRLCLRRR